MPCGEAAAGMVLPVPLKATFLRLQPVAIVLALL